MGTSEISLTRQRAASKKLRVCFPTGKVLCYASSKETFLQTLRNIDHGLFNKVDLELCHLPLLSRTIYPKYRKYMEDIGGGWYVNVQSDTDAKYRQLTIINEQLQLDLIVDMSSDFKGERVGRGAKAKGDLKVLFPNGKVIFEGNNQDTFINCIWELGIENVKRKNIQHVGKDLLTSIQKYSGQVQVGEHTWLTVPSSTKDKMKLLKIIGIALKQDLRIFNGEGETLSIKARPEKLAHGPRVTFDDGTIIEYVDTKELFIECIREFGVEAVRRTRIGYRGYPIVSSKPRYMGQKEIVPYRWIHVPVLNVEKKNCLIKIADMLGLQIKIYLPND